MKVLGSLAWNHAKPTSLDVTYLIVLCGNRERIEGLAVSHTATNPARMMVQGDGLRHIVISTKGMYE
jgi:hypothetical protein